MKPLQLTQEITNTESISVRKYLNEIANKNLLSHEEEFGLGKMAHAGDKQAADKLVTSNLKFVISVAKQYQNQGLSLEDLISEGNIGLIKAAPRFDPTKGFKFISYAVWWIRLSIIKALNEISRLVKIPHNLASKSYKIKNERGLLSEELEREPTLEELAEALDLTINNVWDGLSDNMSILRLDAPISDDNSATNLDLIPCNEMMEKIEQGETLDHQKNTINSVLGNALSEKQATYTILHHCSGKTFKAIGEEYGGKTKQAIESTTKKAIEILRKPYNLKVLRECV